jgi:hypothetical protein
MIHNLGRVFLILFIPFVLYANSIKIEAPNSFYSGDTVVFKLTASGSGEVLFPDITNIEGFVVQNAGTSSQTSVINGVRSQKLVRTYGFKPNKDVTIPSFSATIDGKEYKTQAKVIKKLRVEKTTSPYFDLDISVDKKDVYVGEEVRFTLKFKYDKNLQVVRLNFEKPQFENFWVKELSNPNQQSQKGKYVYQELNYILFPQKAGKLSIEPLKIGIEVVDNRGGANYGFFGATSTKNIPVYSNELELNIKHLPQGVNLVGDFDISATIDKSTINKGDAVAYKVQIVGRGNIDDIDEKKLQIDQTTIYDNPATKEFNLVNNVYGGKYSKSYSIVANSDFTIPSIELKYFDKKTAQVKVKKTKSYTIKVKGAVKKQNTLEVAPKLQSNDKPQEVQKVKEVIKTKVVTTSDNQKIIYYFLGILSALLIFIVYNTLKNRKKDKKDKPVVSMIKKAKTKQELLKLLVVYINIDKQLDKIIYKLEDQKDTSSLKELKKDIADILKDDTSKIKL